MVDRQNLRTWLSRHGQRTAIALCFRSAARTLPLYMHRIKTPWAPEAQKSGLDVMRTAFLTSASAWGAISDQEVRRLAGAWADEAAQALIEFPSHGTPSVISSLAALAHDYALRVATNEQQHVQPAINAIEAAIDAMPEVEAAFTADRFEAETGGQFALTPLWPRGAP